MALTFKKEDGDIVISASGRLLAIEGAEKLSQEVGDTLLSDYNPARGTGSEVRKITATMMNPGVMPLFGDAFMAKAVEDSMERLASLQSRDARTTPLERLDTSQTRIDIRHPTKKSSLFLLTVAPQQGPRQQHTYRSRYRHQYPNRDARTVFPVGVTTDDSVPK